MEIREAHASELETVKHLIDSFEELDTDESTYTLEYYRDLLDEHLVLVAVANDETETNDIIGACFGKYNADQDWADMVGLAVREDRQSEGIGTALVRAFEEEIREHDISTIDLFADETRQSFFSELGYEEGRTYVALRKQLE